MSAVPDRGTARTIRQVVDVLLGALCAVGAALVLADLASPARPAVVLVGLVLGSGWAVVGWIPLPDEVAYSGGLALAAGVAVPIAVSVVLVEGHWWHPVGASGAVLAVAAGLNLALVGWHALGRGTTSRALAGTAEGTTAAERELVASLEPADAGGSDGTTDDTGGQA